MYEAPFQIKHIHNVRIVRFLRISHQNQMHRLLFLHFHCVDTVNSREERLGIGGNVCEIGFEKVFKGVEVGVGHRFDDKVFVMRKEEKAATLTLGLTSFKDLVSI